MRHALEDVLPFLLSHTAADTDDETGIVAFEPLQLAELAVNLLLCLVANATGIQQNQVSTVRLARDLIAETDEDARHAL
jgi:hypothetical protein